MPEPEMTDECTCGLLAVQSAPVDYWQYKVSKSEV
jgi:hypothetical protein